MLISLIVISPDGLSYVLIGVVSSSMNTSNVPSFTVSFNVIVIVANSFFMTSSASTVMPSVRFVNVSVDIVSLLSYNELPLNVTFTLLSPRL